MFREIESALAAWREAVRPHERTVNGDTGARQATVQSTRDEFQRLSMEYMAEWIDAVHNAESRRAAAIRSTERVH